MNIKKQLVLILSVLLVLSVSLSACSCSSSNDDSKKGGVSQKILRLAIPSEITATDPALSSDVNSGQVLSKIYEKLLTFDQNLNLAPDLADTYEINSACTEFTFKLKQNVKFSDGVTTLNSKHVKDSFERIINPKTSSPRANIFEKLIGYDEYAAGKTSEVSGIKIVNDYEIKLSIKEPFMPFLYNLAMVPASITANVNNELLGTGPFVFSQKSDGSKIKLRKNNNYYRANEVFIDEIVYKIIKDELTQITEFEIGNIDILNLSTVNVNNFIKKNQNNYNIHKQPKLNAYYIAFNLGKNMFSEKLRKAMNYAINREELIKTLMKDTMTVSSGPFPPALNYFDPSLEGYKYDPEKAKQLIKEENLKDLKFDLYFKSSFEYENIMQMIKEDLGKVGIEIKLKKMEWAALKSEIVKGNLSMYYLNWSADFPDAHNFLIPLFHSKNKGAGGNRAFFDNPECDKLMEQLEKTSNRDEYKKLAQSLQKTIVDKAPWIFLWHEIEYAATQKNIENYKVPQIYSMEKFINLKIN